MNALAGEIAIMWLAIGRLGVACIFGFLFLWSIVCREIDKSASIVRVYPCLHREGTFVGRPLVSPNLVKFMRRQR